MKNLLGNTIEGETTVSGIVGIFNLDGQPVDTDLVSRMTHAIRHRGPDGSGEWVDGSVALGQTMFHTTPESLAEKLPLTDETKQICLTFDGRVDNRKELRRALVAKGAKLRNDTDQQDACPTDSELVLRAYECWDESCVERILGDWAFAIWPLLPNSVKKTIRWLRSQVSRVEEIAVEPWIDSDFAIRHHLKERLNRRQIPSFLPIRSVSKQLLYNLFTASYNMIFALEFNNRVMSRLSLEKRHPFLDRRLLDFCLAIPEQERLGDGINKFLLRKALHGILPKAIEQRKFKVIFDSLWNEEINVRHANSVNRLFENLRLEADGVLKRGEAHRLLTEFRQGNTRAAGPVDAILFLELWYRNH